MQAHPQTVNNQVDSYVDSLAQARKRTLQLIEPLSDSQLEQVFTPLMSPLIWDIGHIAAFEELWLIHNYGNEPLSRPELASVYDAFETPRSMRVDSPHLRSRECFDFLESVRERALSVIDRLGVADGLIHELVIRHENQHNETMLQTLNLARLADYQPTRRQLPKSHSIFTGLEMTVIESGPFTMGAPDDRFAYDNECSAHEVDVDSFEIGITPVTNKAFLEFVDAGGYQQRKWWSDAGWEWKEKNQIQRPGNWSDDNESEWRIGGLTRLDLDQPVIHISWYEADAFANANDARLPTEAEWEKAAVWDGKTGKTLSYPWGESSPDNSLANCDCDGFGPAQVGAFPAGKSPGGCLGMVGDVWEWTTTNFNAYPGFVANPYPEYSEVFFGDEYKVLRGGSWATNSRVATPTFRNWDYPQRRQIFSGIRLARTIF